jgi:hypothetical protein
LVFVVRVPLWIFIRDWRLCFSPRTRAKFFFHVLVVGASQTIRESFLLCYMGS